VTFNRRFASILTGESSYILHHHPSSKIQSQTIQWKFSVHLRAIDLYRAQAVWRAVRENVPAWAESRRL